MRRLIRNIEGEPRPGEWREGTSPSRSGRLEPYVTVSRHTAPKVVVSSALG